MMFCQSIRGSGKYVFIELPETIIPLITTHDVILPKPLEVDSTWEVAVIEAVFRHKRYKQSIDEGYFPSAICIEADIVQPTLLNSELRPILCIIPIGNRKNTRNTIQLTPPRYHRISPNIDNSKIILYLKDLQGNICSFAVRPLYLTLHFRKIVTRGQY